MMIVSKGYTSFRIEEDKSIRVVVYETLPELVYSSRAIAGSLQALLQYEVKSNPGMDRSKLITEYFKKRGWLVEHLPLSYW